MMENKFEKILTSYGYKREGQSRFVVIAPHAGGDDLRSGIVARRLAKRLDAFLVVNKKFFKGKNYKAGIIPDHVEDFYKLRWSEKRGRYLWARKCKSMKNFYKRVAKYCLAAREFSPDKKAVAIYIHGMDDTRVGLDLGVGLKAPKGNYRFTWSAKDESNNSGKTTLKISDLKKLKKLLDAQLKEKFGLDVSIGKKYIGWSKCSANQFHKHEGRDDYAIQLEFNLELRKKENMREAVAIVSEAIRKVFLDKTQ